MAPRCEATHSKTHLTHAPDSRNVTHVERKQMKKKIEIDGQFYGELVGKAFYFDWYEAEPEQADGCIPVFVPALAEVKRYGGKFLFAYSTENKGVFCIALDHAERVGKVVNGWLRVYVNHWDESSRDAEERFDRMARMERAEQLERKA